jgi:hypothetical protein
MEKLDWILNACVAMGDKTTKDELLGAAFVVVNKDGEAPSASCLSSSHPPRCVKATSTNTRQTQG